MNRRNFFQFATAGAVACKVGLPAVRKAETQVAKVQQSVDGRGISARVLEWAPGKEVRHQSCHAIPVWGIPGGIEVINPSHFDYWYLSLTAQIVDRFGNPAFIDQGGKETILDRIDKPGRSVVYDVDYWEHNPIGSPFVMARFRVYKNFRNGAKLDARLAWDGKPYRDVVFGEPPQTYPSNPGFDTGELARAAWSL